MTPAADGAIRYSVKSIRLSPLASAAVRSIAPAKGSPTWGNVMFPMVVIPPTTAAREPLAKSSLQ